MAAARARTIPDQLSGSDALDLPDSACIDGQIRGFGERLDVGIKTSRCGQSYAIFPDVTERIVAVRLIRIGHVKINDPISVRSRNTLRDTSNKVAVRIDE